MAEAADVVVVGAGLSGSITAALLARQGIGVILVDRNERGPADFRAEQLVGPQIAALDRLGLLDGLDDTAARHDHVVAARNGRVVCGVDDPHYGFRYESLVRHVRRRLPRSVRFVTGRVEAIENTTSRQCVRLNTGQHLSSRLVAIATGPWHGLLGHLGVRRQVLSEGHSITIGFDIAPPPGERLAAPLMTYLPNHIRDRIDYLAVFSADGHARANLFAYHKARDPWVRRFRDDPAGSLRQALPGLQDALGRFSVSGPVQLRLNDISRALHHRIDGVVLIGDSFQTTCPATGTGITRVLTDAERLCETYVGDWLRTDGMDAGKLAAFYDDPVKRQVDDEAVRVAHYQRAAATEGGCYWTLHRMQVRMRQRLGGMIGGPAWLTLGAGKARLPAPPSWATDIRTQVPLTELAVVRGTPTPTDAPAGPLAA